MLKMHTWVSLSSSRRLFKVCLGAEAFSPKWTEMGSSAGDTKALLRDL